MKQLFKKRPALVGMVHVRALPGTARYAGNFKAVVDKAVEEATVLLEGGVDGLILENMHDTPYLKGSVGPEITAAMAVVADRIRALTERPVGLQILAAANREALAVALTSRLDFVRVEGFVFGHVADEGYIDGQAGELLRYRKMIGAESVQIWADLKKKHSSHALTADVGLGETAQAAEFCGADAVIVTGSSTGKATLVTDLEEVTGNTGLPVWIGSGVTPENAGQYRNAAGFIVGSYLKEAGKWDHPVSRGRIARIKQSV